MDKGSVNHGINAQSNNRIGITIHLLPLIMRVYFFEMV